MKVMIILMLSILPLLPSFSHGESAECSLENSDSKSNYFVGNKELVGKLGNDSNLLIVFYVQIMPDDFVMQPHRF